MLPKGTNPTTHLPAFSRTVTQEPVSALAGGLDHVKWLVYMNHLASSGVPGFDAPLGQKLVCQTTLGGLTTGTGFHPFGSAVANPQDDLRLASLALNTLDFETCGMGTFSLLDGHGAQNKGLTQLSASSNFYFNPMLGAPTPEAFVDPHSLQSSRLFGQGAILTARRPSVGTVAANQP